MKAIRPFNFCRQIRQWLPKAEKAMESMVRTNDELATDAADELVSVRRLIALVARPSQKFCLPDGGLLLVDPDLRGLDRDVQLHLPYPAVALEFISDHQSEGLGGSITRCVMFARESGEKIEVSVALGVRIDGVEIWRSDPPFLMGAVRDSDDGVPEIWVEEGNTEGEFAGLIRETNVIAAAKLASFINVLACSNVKAIHLEDRKSSKESSLPFDSYYALSVDCGFSSDDHHSSSQMSRSPREHLRRGHIRRLSSGRRVWVNATLVNPGTIGKVKKDYVLH